MHSEAEESEKTPIPADSKLLCTTRGSVSRNDCKAVFAGPLDFAGQSFTIGQ